MDSSRHIAELAHEANRLKCASCGADKDERELAPVEVAVGVTVDVCRWRGSKLNDCARRARQDVCPGCGRSLKDDRAYVSGLSFEATIACSRCRTALAKGRAEMSRPAEEARKFSYLDADRILGPAFYRVSDYYERGKAFARLLARVAGGRTEKVEGERHSSHGYVPPYVPGGFNSTHADVAVEVTSDQHEALCGLAELLPGILADVRAAGYAEGEDLLGRLASGKLTIAEYEDASVKAKPKKEG